MPSESQSIASSAPCHDLVRLLQAHPLVEIVVAHHHGRRPATGQAFDKFDSELAVLGRLRAVAMGIQSQLLAEVFVELVRPSAQLSVRQTLR